MTGRNILIGIAVLAALGLGIYLFQRGDAGADLGNNDEENGVACTLDAKLCPDGSYVGRVPPNCEFAACPSDSDGTSTDGEDETPFFDKG